MGLYDSYSNLQVTYRALIAKLERYESGEEYNRTIDKIESQSKRAIKLETKNIKLKDENKKISSKNKDLIFDNRKHKYEVKYLEKENADLKKSLHSLEIDILKKEISYDQNTTKLNEVIDTQASKIKLLEEVLKKLEDLNQKMTTQLNRDYTNSSLPSSQIIGKKKIFNSREKSDKKVGGQVGHKGHGRKSYLSTDKIIVVPRPENYADESVFIETGKVIKKQIVDITIGFEVIEYQFKEYKNKESGCLVHAPIPASLHNEISYGNHVKGLAILLNSEGNVSIDKTIEIIYEISNQEIKLSKGFVNGLNGKVAHESKSELDEIFKNLQLFKYMHIDASSVRVNGKNVNVFVTANPNDTYYYARENKGKKGVAATAAEDYTQTLIHDHDRTFYNYGKNHQECLAHILRYLQSSIENEETLTWHKKMHVLLRKMIKSSKNNDLGETEKAAYTAEYESILELSIKEYDDNPPSKYYREGINLAKRLNTYQDSTLYFLEDQDIPYTNNLAERQLRKIKRKARVVGSFRSFQGLESYCKVQSLIEKTKNIKASVFKKLASKFEISLN